MNVHTLDKTIRDSINIKGKHATLKILSRSLRLETYKKYVTIFMDEGGCNNQYILMDAYILRYESNPHTNRTEFFPEIKREDVPSLTWFMKNIKSFRYPYL
jgi:hypothetical protein